MEKQGSVHAIAAVNPVYGVVNFIVLNLPPGWTLKTSPLPPLVDEVARRGVVKWVVSGSIIGLAVDREKGRALEVEVRVSKKPRRLGFEPHGKTIVNSHEAFYVFGVEKRGLLRRKTLNTLHVYFYCNETSRFVEISFKSSATREVFEEVLRYLEGSQCH